MNPHVTLKPMRFLTLNEVMTLHEAAIDQFGGSHGVRDQGGVEAAVMMPQQGFGGQHVHAFPFEMAAAYAFHIAERQAFIDGNKRTALSSCIAFLRLNGWSLVVDEMEAADQILGFASKTQTKAGFAQWLELNSRLRPSMELREFFAKIDWQMFRAAFSAVAPDAPGGSQHEAVMSMDECRANMPFADGLAAALLESQRQGDEAGRIVALSALKTATALYRLAEDMGYEW